MTDDAGHAAQIAALQRARRTLNSAIKKKDAAWEAARIAALEAIANGVQEAVAARELGVNRMTVRKWLGKGR